jgi:hypothetical protein
MNEKNDSTIHCIISFPTADDSSPLVLIMLSLTEIPHIVTFIPTQVAICVLPCHCKSPGYHILYRMDFEIHLKNIRSTKDCIVKQKKCLIIL